MMIDDKLQVRIICATWQRVVNNSFFALYIVMLKLVCISLLGLSLCMF